MPSVKIAKTQEELNDIGCEMLLCANESRQIRLTSTEMRWLTIKKENSNDYYTIRQKEICEYIDEIAKNYGGKDWAKWNMKILLYKDPTKKQEEHIKKLIKTGADIRYIPLINTTKILLQDNKLFISFALNFDKVVNTGILYTGLVKEDPVIDYCKNLFDDEFSRARKILLNNDGDLVFEDGWLTTITKCVRAYKLKDWVTLIFGALVGAVISGIVSLLLSLAVNN